MRILAAGLTIACLAATPAAAFDPPVVWVGQMVFLDLAGCGGGGADTVAIVYRPKLQPAEDNSTLTYSFGFAFGTVTKKADSLQLAGKGSYSGTFVTGYATQRTNTGTFDLTVSPAVVTPSTNFITFSGTFTNFVGLSGCKAKVRGSASRHP